MISVRRVPAPSDANGGGGIWRIFELDQTAVVQQLCIGQPGAQLDVDAKLVAQDEPTHHISGSVGLPAGRMIICGREQRPAIGVIPISHGQLLPPDRKREAKCNKCAQLELAPLWPSSAISSIRLA